MENPLGRGIFQSALNVGERGSPEGARTDGGGSSARPAVPSPGKHWEVEPPRLALTRADEALPGADRLPDHRLHFHRALSSPGPLQGVCQSSRHSPGGEVREKAVS